jgi:uncharacterized protein YggE
VDRLESGIVVIGRGEVRAHPDVARVVIGVNVIRESVARASRDAAESATAVLDALGTGGVADDDVQTASLTVQPSYEYPPAGGARLVGYAFTHTVSATLRDLGTAPRVLDAALAAGGDDAVLQGVSFALEDDGEARRAARDHAFGDAQARAAQLARLAGLQLGPALAIEELAPDDGPPVMLAAARVSRMDAGGPPIAVGQVTTTVTVAVRFALSATG